MSCQINKINGMPNSSMQKEFICDSEDDIFLLPRYGMRGNIDDPNDFTINEPCAIGSTAIVCKSESVSVWILSPSNEWVKI